MDNETILARSFSSKFSPSSVMVSELTFKSLIHFKLRSVWYEMGRFPSGSVVKDLPAVEEPQEL